MVVIDGNAYTSRPGPRIVEGAEKIREAFSYLARSTTPASRAAPTS